jgi:signal transduction histidine kinase
MKFTFQGHIKIIAKLTLINDEDAVEMSVVDTGVGIKQED